MKLGELFSARRQEKRISLARASRDLLIKAEILEKIENEDWKELPEKTIVGGFIKNYAGYLGLETKYLLAFFRREYDERQYPKKTAILEEQKSLRITPKRFINFLAVLAIAAFISYLILQYTSILSAPKLEISSPPDDLTTTVSVVLVAGRVERGSVISVGGEFVPVDADGNFSYQLKLNDGRNVIEIIASRRLSPKSKTTRVVRLVR